ILDPHPHEVAAPEFAVDRQVEQREIASAPLQLEANANGPHILRLQRALLAGQPSLIPGRVPARGGRGFGGHGLLRRSRPRPHQPRIALDRLDQPLGKGAIAPKPDPAAVAPNGEVRPLRAIPDPCPWKGAPARSGLSAHANRRLRSVRRAAPWLLSGL